MPTLTRDELARRRQLLEEARRITETLLPDPDIRACVVRAFIELIETAHETAPGSWLPSFDLQPLEVRVSVGMTWGLTIKANRSWFLVDKARLGPEQLRRVGDGEMKTPPGVCLYEITDSADIPKELPLIRGAHLEAVRRAARYRPENPNYRKAYSPGLLAYFEESSGTQLPRPAYERKLAGAVVGAEAIDDLPIQETIDMSAVTDPTTGFSERTFELLGELHRNPQKDFYLAHKTDFVAHVESPAQRLMRDVVAQLPASVKERLETEKGLFGRILKNDWGRGGTWDFFWGTLFPKGGKKFDGVQLYISVRHDRIEYGFGFSDFDSDQQPRFRRNVRQFASVLLGSLGERLSRLGLISGPMVTLVNGELDPAEIASRRRWEDVLRDPGEEAPRLVVVLPAASVLQRSWDDLVAGVLDAFLLLYPLALLAMLDDPREALATYLETPWQDEETAENYPFARFAEETGFAASLLQRWVRATNRKGQAILYGPPGTGKTYVAERLARHLVGGADGFWEVVQFHPAYAYEEFVQGIRPRLGPNGEMTYQLTRGRFLEFCTQASRCSGLCVLIVDEINRANLARVFGELMYLLEYRDQEIQLAAGEYFRIPRNVRLIGTMNTADRSIALVDHALRRRFAFLELRPDFEVLRHYHVRNRTGFDVDGLIAVLQTLNRAIADPHYEVGISFFMRMDLRDQIQDIWRMEIEPYLDEYFSEQRDKVEQFEWAAVEKDIVG
jgi:5-methylcytosine-specific restriction enzyme B